MFNLSTAKQLVSNSQTSDFVVDFDLVWQWLGYSTKGNAKRKFESSGFVVGQDFSEVIRNDKLRPQGGTSNEVEIYLTIDCVKAFCMMANTEQGKQVRSYFIEAEKQLRQIKQPELVKPIETPLMVANSLVNLNESTLPASVKQLMIDSMVATYLTQKQLPGSNERWLGVAQKAEELGYEVTHSNRGKLGKFVKALGLEGKKEERLINGQMRTANVYLDSDVFSDSIRKFFS